MRKVPNMSVSIGIIGAGIMGERLLRAILDQRADLVTAAGIWDPSETAMARMAAALPDVPRLADAAAVMAAGDCVYVASPPASHLGHARAALAAGKAVFCEKPLAVDVAAARAFVAEAGGRGAVNFPFASSPAVATLRRWIGEGAVGRVTGVSIEVAFAAWPRSWQVDAAGWLDRPAEGEAGAVRLCDWSVAERRNPDGTWQRDPDALPNEKMRPLTLKTQLEGVARLARGEPHHLATLAEALDVQEIVEAILRS